MRRSSRTLGVDPAPDRRTLDLSLRLAEARLTQGIGMDRLARTLGCPLAQIERMETGRAALSAATLVDWVLALDLDLVVQPRHVRQAWPDTARPHTSADTRLLEAYQTADNRTRDAVALMLGLDRPPSPPVRLTRPGRPQGPAATPRSLRLTLDQLDALRQSPVPYTGNRVLTALKLADGTITALAHATCLRYARVARIVSGKLREVPEAYAAELATAFGCLAQDLFPAVAAGAPVAQASSDSSRVTSASSSRETARTVSDWVRSTPARCNSAIG